MFYKINLFSYFIGIVWTLLFAMMSIYWAMGGMIGIRSLGGSIYEQALNPEPSFVAIVWITGLIKLFGAILLIMSRVQWQSPRMRFCIYLSVKMAGIFIFLYGLLNFTTIGLHAIDMLDFALDRYATAWRLLFWEPFWMVGGISYYFSVEKCR